MSDVKRSELEVFNDALARILTADPSVVKSAMEQEKKERAEERKKAKENR